MRRISLFFMMLFLMVQVQGQAQNWDTTFQGILDSFYVAHPLSVGIMVHVEAPDQDISWSAARGHDGKGSEIILQKDQPTLVASCTKTYVSATILKLVERRQISLDQSIKKLISRRSKRWLKKDGYLLDDIKVKHLLSHTSGIHDHVTDEYFSSVNEQPQYQWTRKAQIQYAMKHGAPLALAGEQFAYADINFLLLTEILEKIHKEPFYQVIRKELAYEKNGLADTWFTQLETKPVQTKSLAHQYTSKFKWSSRQINPSWDLYGGGGIATTTKDLARFFQLLFTAQIIKDTEVLDHMCTPVAIKEKNNYGMGIRVLDFHGMKAFYHGGFWGTDVMYLPELNMSIAVYTLQKDERELNASISKELIKVYKKYFRD